MKMAEVYEKPPKGFLAKVEVAACYLEINEHFLLLERSTGVEAKKWGVPAGKLELNETPEEAAVRELFEETGIRIQPNELHSVGILYIRKPEVDYVYHPFKINLTGKPEVRLSSEHLSFKWLSQSEIMEIPLMDGAIKSFQYYREKIALKSSLNGM